MSRKAWLVLGVAVVVGMAVANGDRTKAANPVVDQRRELMKDNAKQMKTINDFLEKGEGDASMAAAAAQKIQADSAKIPDLFPPGTSLDDDVGKTGAKPEIWVNFDRFKAAASKLGDLAGALSAAARTGDKTAIGQAFAAAGKEGCGACHQDFRKKLD